jgi:hypothetical protein
MIEDKLYNCGLNKDVGEFRETVGFLGKLLIELQFCPFGVGS